MFKLRGCLNRRATGVARPLQTLKRPCMEPGEAPFQGCRQGRHALPSPFRRQWGVPRLFRKMARADAPAVWASRGRRIDPPPLAAFWAGVVPPPWACAGGARTRSGHPNAGHGAKVSRRRCMPAGASGSPAGRKGRVHEQAQGDHAEGPAEGRLEAVEGMPALTAGAGSGRQSAPAHTYPSPPRLTGHA